MPARYSALAMQIPAIHLNRGAYFTAPELDLHATDFTIGARVKVRSTANRNIILGNWSSEGQSWQLLLAVLAGGKLAVNLRKDMETNGSDPDQDLVALVGNTALQAGVAAKIAVTFTWGADRRTPKATLYVNGAVDGEQSPAVVVTPVIRNPYTLMATSNPYLIGRKQDSSDDDSYYAGEIADLQIYTFAMSATQVGNL